MLSRRKFLAQLAATATALSLDPFRGISTAGNQYSNVRLHLSLSKPADWSFSSIADFAALRERQVLQDVLNGHPHPLKDPGNLPVFLFERTAHRDGPFVPGIALYDEPLAGTAPDDQTAAHQWMLDRFSESYAQMRVLVAPDLLQLNRSLATHADWSYLHQIEGGFERRIWIRSLLVFREPRVHTFYFVDDSTAPCIDPAIWREVEQSITYTA